jgi:hypothetical protein
MEQTEQEKKVVGYNVVDKPLLKDNAKEGMYCFHALLPQSQLTKIQKLDGNYAKLQLWSETKGKMISVLADYADLYVKVQVPVYE